MNIRVSDLNAYCFCPRGIYLSKVLKIKQGFSIPRSIGLISHSVRRELSIRQPILLEKMSCVNDINMILECELDNILSDALHMHRGMLDDVEYNIPFEKIRLELLSEIRIMRDKLTSMIEEIGLEEAIRHITPWMVEYPVKSDTLKLSGRIDKVMKDPGYVPVEIKTGSAPSCIWNGDRIQICAYILLLEDTLKLNKRIPFGFVEYTQIQQRRPVMATEGLRGEVIHKRDKIIEILEGFVPDACAHGSERKCMSCGYKEQCYE